MLIRFILIVGLEASEEASVSEIKKRVLVKRRFYAVAAVLAIDFGNLCQTRGLVSGERRNNNSRRATIGKLLAFFENAGFKKKLL